MSTKRTSSLEKFLNERYVYVPGYNRKVGLSYTNPEKWGQSFTFAWKKGLIIYFAALKKRGAFDTHIRTMPYIGSFSPPTPHPGNYPRRGTEYKWTGVQDFLLAFMCAQRRLSLCAFAQSDQGIRRALSG